MKELEKSILFKVFVSLFILGVGDRRMNETELVPGVMELIC